ncbi:hypothetical protein SAMN05216206_3895 [Pseudomonas guineae]|uniref:Uncharacterized protein n=1 Tax=Pseudomonas guineae TaxID=425504 RepID=A0A1I3QBG7_9PSED|nr:hypothetical protein [Pseudomonas guineae]SFJ31035.1 hypothetical protein SAMN05216206_3895 [Pseudomonas guineae]
MESKIPLPTDNLYKFVALFSLVLLISAFGTIIWATNAANGVAFEHWVEIESLQSKEALSVEQASRLKALEKQIEVAVADKETYVTSAQIISTLGTLGIFFGFGYWYKRLQPIADEMAATQLEIAKLQLVALRADLKAKGIDVGTP